MTRPQAEADRGGIAHVELGLTDAEYERIVELMGREPNEVELAMFSLLWSEHCGYKHSRKLLKTLPTEGPRVVMGPGENAGAVDVGGGMACAFKVESHNHPSAVEPFQGAATGVGGILRDVFAVGARPIAVLDSLRFGEPGESARSRYLLEHAVAGIGHYGNSIGVATVGGEIYFESAYEQNCLVNAMCLGLIETEKLIRSAAAGVGNVVVLFGARTGRDGIGGASVLASAELGDEDSSKRPTVQIGDPFEEAKLLECSLELLDRGLLVALQDLGAAGLTSSSSEMAAKGGVGIDLDVRRVPLREADMEPFEIMVSESQERMLCVVEPVGQRPARRRIDRDGGRRGLEVVGRALVDQRGDRQVAGDLVADQHAQAACVGDDADRGRVHLPLLAHAHHGVDALGLDDAEHPLLRLGDHDLERLHAVLAQRHLRDVEVEPDPALRRHLGRRGREAGRTEVLQRHEQPAVEQLERALQQLGLLERIADLHGRALG